MLPRSSTTPIGTLLRMTTLLRSQILLPIKKRKRRKGQKGGAARDTAKIKRLDAHGTPAAKAEAERIRRKRLHGGRTTERQRRVEKQQIGTFIGLRIEQHYMKIAELNAEAASSSQQ